ncbi:MAG TPA: ABC transporter permease [Marinilabiliaceae bacterium]|nr:ABC transporter permease [Marinilabiliaceae bacterium]
MSFFKKIEFLRSKDWKLIKRFGRYFAPHKKWIFISLASIPITTFGGILFLWLVERIIDDFILTGDIPGLKLYTLIAAAVLGINFLFDGLYSYSFTKAGGLAIMDMRRTLFGRSLRFPMRYYDKNPIGITLSRLTSDMESIAESFASGILGLLSDSIKTLALTAYLFYINWQLTLVVGLVVPIIYLTIRFFRKKIRKAFDESRSSLAKSAGYLQETLYGMKTIQLYAASETAYKKYDGFNKQYADAQNRSNVYDGSLYSIIDGITSVATALVIWFGAAQVWNLDYTIGVLIVFITTLGRLFVPVRQFAQQITTIQRALSALDHISVLSEQDVEEAANGDAQAIEFDEIVFKEVYFRYSPDAPDVLKNISFTLRKGDRIALVGTTGSGKSTIIRLLTGAYTGYRGSITINGMELRDIPLQEIRQTVSVMQQDIYLFNDTIGFNIGLGRKEIEQADIEEAARFVYADRFIERLPGKYDFVIQDNGDNLSKGQGQLISFARAISGERELIILDEATSAVDSITEHYIQMAIENIFSTRTVIAVAHRLSTIKHSNLILVLENGAVIERGTHQSLLDLGGKYAGLVKEMVEKPVN